MPESPYPYEHIELDKIGHVAWLRFNRVKKANAMNYAHLWEVEHAALSLREDADIRVVVITGNGPHFAPVQTYPIQARQTTCLSYSVVAAQGLSLIHI